MSTSISGARPRRVQFAGASSRDVTVTASLPSARGGGWWETSGTGDDRRVGASAPFSPGTVVDRRLRRTGEVEREADDTGGDARATARRHFSRGIDAGRLDARLELGGRQHGAALGIEQVVVGQVERARHMAGAQAGARLGRLAAEAVGGARIDDLLAFAVEQRLH